MIDLAKLIKDAREKANLTQSELGGLVDCTWDHISKIERGQKKPSPKIFEKMLNILSIDVPQNFKEIINKDTQYRTDFLQSVINNLRYLNESDTVVLTDLIESLAQKNKKINLKRKSLD